MELYGKSSVRIKDLVVDWLVTHLATLLIGSDV